MGGDAFKTFKAKRILSREIYEQLCNKVTTDLKDLYGQIQIPPCCADKSDFGDIDVIVCDTLVFSPKDILVERWKSKEVVSNGRTISFELDDYQIDIHHSFEQSFDMCIFYQSYAILGMAFGMMIKRVGLSLGEEGLWMNLMGSTDGNVNVTEYKNKAEYFATIILTKDPKSICEVLGVDYEIWKRGFTTQEELFRFITSSSLFDKSIFIKEHINYKTKKQYNRPAAQNFLSWLESLESKENGVRPNMFRLSMLKKFNKVSESALLLEKERMRREMKKKFNGEIVTRLTGLKGKELGDFMKKCRKEGIEELIHQCGSFETEQLITEYYQQK